MASLKSYLSIKSNMVKRQFISEICLDQYNHYALIAYVISNRYQDGRKSNRSALMRSCETRQEQMGPRWM